MGAESHGSFKVPKTCLVFALLMILRKFGRECRNSLSGDEVADYVQCRAAHIKETIDAEDQADVRRINPNPTRISAITGRLPPRTPAVPIPARTQINITRA